MMRLKIGAALIITYLAWGGTFIANRFALQSFPPFLLNAVRFLIAGVVLLSIERLRGMPRLDIKGWGWSLLAGVFLFAGCGGFVTVGQQYVNSSLASILTATIPMWTVLFLSFSEGFPRKNEILGLLLGGVGVAILNLDQGVRSSFQGVSLCLLSAACWGVGSFMNRRVKALRNPNCAGVQLLGGGMAVLFVGLLQGERVLFPLTGAAILAELHLSIMGGVVAFCCFRFLLDNVKASLATSYAFASPVVACFLGWWLADETVTLTNIIATCVILCGVRMLMAEEVSRESKVSTVSTRPLEAVSLKGAELQTGEETLLFLEKRLDVPVSARDD